MKRHPIAAHDLQSIARRAMREAGFQADFPPAALQELAGLDGNAGADPPRDLTELLWSSIDNDESRDLDQVEFCRREANGEIRVMVGIADVDALVRQDGAIDHHAAANTISVYTGITTFPMLPEELSTDRTSLNPDETRAAIVIDMTVDDDGDVTSRDAYRALVRNHAKLAYESVGAWLEGAGPLPPAAAAVPGLEEQLRLQEEAMERLQEYRRRCGALDFETIEAKPILRDGLVVDIQVPHKSRARHIIENFMVAANQAMADFLEARGIAIIQRVVRSPERWPRIVDLAAELGERLPATPDPRALSAFLKKRKESDPDHFPDLSLAVVKLLGPGSYTMVEPGSDRSGHFGLAVHNYTHSTAPNRRFADLTTQRLLKAALGGGAPPYSNGELETIAERCTERENAARKVERRMRKVAAAALFADYIGRQFEAIVTGASNKGTYVRTLDPPVEGRVEDGRWGLDVGDHVRVRLVHTDVERGFIDFDVVKGGRTKD